MEIVYGQALVTTKERKTEEPTLRHIEICRLFGRYLETPLVVTVEPLHRGFKAYAADVSLYGYGCDVSEAVEALRQGIERIFEVEEFLDFRAAIQNVLPPENHATDEEEAPQKDKPAMQSPLLQAQTMEAIGMLASGIAHNFNNILTTVMGYANLLQMKIDPTDLLRIYVDRILVSTGRAANLTQGLLAFSGNQMIDLKPHRVGFLIKNAERLLRRLLHEEIALEIVIGDDSMVMADVSLIDQMLINLTTNAHDAMPRGGRLRIETKRAEIDDAFRISHGYGEPGAYALISVTDTGTGMDENTLRKVFDPFFTTKEMGKAIGLGLSTVYGTVKQHNGYITAHSKPGAGAAFHIYLPTSI